MTRYSYQTRQGTFTVDAPDLAHALTALRAEILRSGAAVAFPQAGRLKVEDSATAN